MEQATIVKLITSDGQSRDVLYNIIKLNKTIAAMIDDDGFDTGDEGLPLTNVSAATLDKVIRYCEYHQNDCPLTENRVEMEITGWDAEFMNMPKSDLFEVILAANFLDNKPLLDLGCKKVGSMIRGKTPDEIRIAFDIVNDFTPEEEAQIRKENEWCQEELPEE